MTVLIVIAVAALMLAIERLWPGSELPTVRNWWQRVVLINLAQAGMVVLAGLSWDRWLQAVSIIGLADLLPLWGQAVIGYVLITFVYYFWHRVRHESKFFWLLCHQLHHSPQRLEVLMSFYKHPVELALNSLLTGTITFLILGISVEAAAIVTVMTGVAELFYHWNVRTPKWFGYIFQRPESHRVHHQRSYHTNNYSDIPLWDMLFGTFENPDVNPKECGFDPVVEDRFEDMLVFRDANKAEKQGKRPVGFLPTCIGCSKRWACQMAMTTDDTDPDPISQELKTP